MNSKTTSLEANLRARSYNGIRSVEQTALVLVGRREEWRGKQANAQQQPQDDCRRPCFKRPLQMRSLVSQPQQPQAGGQAKDLPRVPFHLENEGVDFTRGGQDDDEQRRYVVDQQAAKRRVEGLGGRQDVGEGKKALPGNLLLEARLFAKQLANSVGSSVRVSAGEGVLGKALVLTIANATTKTLPTADRATARGSTFLPTSCPKMRSKNRAATSSPLPRMSSSGTTKK